MLYNILYITIIFAFLAKLFGKKSDKWVYPLAVGVLIVYSALKNPFIYPDISGYYDTYRYGADHVKDKLEYGYEFLNWAFRNLSSSFHFFLASISIIVISSYAKVIKDYSPYIWLSLILYILINYYPSFFLIRQYISMAIFIYSIKFIINRKPFYFGIAIFISMSFHPTVVLAAPLYLLYGMKNSKKNMIILTIGVIITVSMFMSLGKYVQMVSGYYASYFEFEHYE